LDPKYWKTSPWETPASLATSSTETSS